MENLIPVKTAVIKDSILLVICLFPRGVMVIMDTATRVQILYKTDYIPHNTKTLGKGMNPIILPPDMGK